MKGNKIVRIRGGITAPKGFFASATEAGIKYSNREDMALIFSQESAVLAGVFTKNRVKAAPVKLCMEGVKRGKAQAIVINSGCANACTGKRGMENARRIAEVMSMELGTSDKDIMVCSTGTIGVQLPMDKIEAAIPKLAASLSPFGGDSASRAILTTDTVPKQEAIEFYVGNKVVRIGGMCKGAGMISPDMATMLCFITTDAAVKQPDLQLALRTAVNKSFNRITVDGDQSTNDTVLVLANGMAGNSPLCHKSPDWSVFVSALEKICFDLAIKIVKDGEGATKFVTVRVNGAASRSDALKAARSVAESLLVKTSWFGADPNWGRIIAAIGYAGIKMNEAKVDISFDGIKAVEGGQSLSSAPLSKLERILKKKNLVIDIDLHVGRASDVIYTCDCSIDYVKINASYMT